MILRALMIFLMSVQLTTACVQANGDIKSQSGTSKCRVYGYRMDDRVGNLLGRDPRIRTLTIDPNDRAVRSGHTGAPYETCEDYGLCILGNWVFYFALPKNWEKLGGEWTYKGARFTVVGHKTLDIGKHRIKTFAIKVTYLDDRIFRSIEKIYYSPENGIVGVVSYGDPDMAVYKVTRLPGYGAHGKSTCKSKGRS